MSTDLPADIDLHLTRGESQLLADLLLGLTDTQRKTLVPAFTARIRSIDNWWQHQSQLGPLFVAGAACLPTAAQTAAWFARRDFRWLFGNVWDVVGEQVVRVLLARQVPWYPDLAARVAGNLPTRDIRPDEWRLAAALVVTSGAPVPTGDGFVVGWIADAVRDPGGSLRERLRADPFLDALLPRLFQVDGVGTWLEVTGWQRSRPGFEAAATGAAALAALAAEGRVSHEDMLGRCLGRLLRGDRPGALRVFVRLHEALTPSHEQIEAHTADYLRLLPDTAPNVAGLAQIALRALDRAGRLRVDTLIEASRAVLARPEKALVRNQLVWLDQALRRGPDRAGDILAAVTIACGHPTLDLQERAVALVERYAARVEPVARVELAAAADSLSGDPRDRVLAALGVEPTTTVSAARDIGGPLPLAPRPMPPAIQSGAELAAETVRLLSTGIVDDPIGFELVLDAIVRMAATQLGELRTCLGPIAARYPGWAERGVSEHSLDHRLTQLIAAVTAEPVPAGGLLRRWLRAAAPAAAPAVAAGYGSVAGPSRVLLSRLDEIVRNVVTSPVSGLLSTPTRATGQVDAEALVERIAVLEATGSQPWPHDLEQALLRLPRAVDPDTVARAGSLCSPAGRRLAARLADGVTDPLIVRITTPRWRSSYWDSYGDQAAPWPRPAARVTPAAPDGPLSQAALVCDPSRPVALFHLPMWPAVLPSHREVIAAHVLPALLASAERDVRGTAGMLPALVESEGPAGPATALAVAYGLATKDQQDRVAAIDALLHLLATDALDPATVGREIAAVSVDSLVKLPRLVGALTDAANAGAANAVWRIATAAIPHLLAADKPPTGAANLLELATRLTPHSARADRPAQLPGLAELAGRPGSGRLVTEARRLQRALA